MMFITYNFFKKKSYTNIIFKVQIILKNAAVSR